MSELKLDEVKLVRTKEHREVDYFAELRRDHSHQAICTALLDAVDQGVVRPTIFSIFLSWSQHAPSYVRCVQQEKSLRARMVGVKHLAKALADPRTWEEAWDSAGGTKGLVETFSKVSVVEVKSLALAIGSCNRGRIGSERREAAIEELLHALLPTQFPESRIKTTDKRPIADHVAQMVYACSDQFVEDLLDAGDRTNPLYTNIRVQRLIKSHPRMLRIRAMRSVKGEVYDDHCRSFLLAFSLEVSPIPAPSRKVCASMAFSMEALQIRVNDKNNEYKLWTGYGTRLEITILQSLYGRAVKRKLEHARIHEILQLALRLIRKKNGLERYNWSLDIWDAILARWKTHPQMYEDLLVDALQLGLATDDERSVGRAMNKHWLRFTRDELQWPLLRLLCMHAPKKGVDIEKDHDLSPLGKFMWPYEQFKALKNEQAIQLLTDLLQAHPEYEFLKEHSGNSILSHAKRFAPQTNFNVILLLTMLQQDNEGVVKGAKNGVDELRRKASTAREQPDRARLAVAASYFAIASGSLELHSENVTWLQRFVRDPLTTKSLYSRDALLTQEGIQLLCGIPDPLPEVLSLAEIESKVRAANAILVTLYETKRIAKKEPSFQEADWRSLDSLTSAVVKARVKAASSLQERLRSSEGDLYSAIWSQTMETLTELQGRALQEAMPAISSVFVALNPALLATVTTTLLDAADQKRAGSERGEGDALIERLSYNCISSLAASDKPYLAQNLILRTILSRPDASSWHRQLLSLGYMKRLGAQDAEGMLLAFATAIGEKLEEQSYVKVGEAANAPSLVKVTTVKYLAQLLDNAEFISIDAAVNVLVELFKSGTHRDIRLATLESLLSMLSKLSMQSQQSGEKDPLVEKILQALESVIPVAGSINEQRPPREQDWVEAEETMALPEPFDDDVQASLPPLLHLILHAPNMSQWPGLRSLREDFFNRLTLPLLKRSEAEHGRWVSLFLRKHNAASLEKDLPPTPLMPLHAKMMLSLYADLLPRDVLERFHAHVMYRYLPPDALLAFNKKIGSTIEQRRSREVRHWYALYAQDMSFPLSQGTEFFIDLIHHNWQPSKVADGVTVEMLQHAIVEQLSALLGNYDEHMHDWDRVVSKLRHPASATSEKMKSWRVNCRPVLKLIVDMVEERRNDQNMLDPADRKPSVFPSTAKLRLWLLPYPGIETSSKLGVEEKCEIFAQALGELVTHMLIDDVLKAHRVAQDAETIATRLTAEERVRVACAIATSPTRGKDKMIAKAQRQVNTELAVHLVDESRTVIGKSAQLKALAGEMLISWQRDDSEDVREKALKYRLSNAELWKEIFAGDKAIVGSEEPATTESPLRSLGT